MRAIALLYHDVISGDDWDSSGFPGGDSAVYKFRLEEFARHIEAIHAAIGRPPITISEVDVGGRNPVLLTFDDGGQSAHAHIADELEALGWRAHFFVTTDWIGRRGFLNQAQIRDLHARGHRIGSHSCSHPQRMSHCDSRQLREEWGKSVAVLSGILGIRVTLASVPGGYYARNVGEAAAQAGIQTLFTSEPQTQTRFISGCRVMGRYTVQRGTSPATAAAIAAGSILPRSRQFVYWNAKKVAKLIGGTSWLRMRRWVLAR